MAVIQHLTSNLVGSVQRVTWPNLGAAAADDTGSPVGSYEHTFKEVQVGIGTSGQPGNTFDGATCTIEGSLDDGTTWATLNDVNGTALTFTAARLERVQESVAMIRPRISSVGASTDITVVLIQKPDGGAA